MRNYKELKIWQRAMQIGKETYAIVNTLPSVEGYGLRSQMTRSAVSISSNIAEGSSRSSDKEFSRFLQIALGSCFELETQLILTKELGLVDIKKSDMLLESILEEQKMISGFLKKLKD